MHTFVSYTMGMVRRDIFYIPEGYNWRYHCFWYRKFL
uniref:Uncharacterized protein n=1 Tax=Brassica oleracea TaxID=3712 RepID=A0A3P6HE86_BRAOL|nr:unnamed protein product [Brassica oleracea]